MNTQKLTICRIFISIILAILFVWSIPAGNSLLVVVAILVGFTFLVGLRRKDKRVHIDERIKLIKEKSATATLNASILGVTLVGVVLLLLDNGGYDGLSLSGFSLLYSACVLMILNTVFGIYYRRKYGG